MERVATKTIGIFGVQMALGAIALASGYAKLSGAPLMVQQFQVLGLGHGFLFMAGTAEILAGLCLLLPRGGILGAILLSGVMVGALGMMIGQAASAVANQPQVPQFTATGYQAGAQHRQAEPIVVVRPRTTLAI